MMKRGKTILLLVLLTFVATATAQRTNKDVAHVDEHYTARSELVLVPVVVSDGSGTHITGLKQENFIVKDLGKPQRVTVFEEIKAAPTARVQKAAVPAHEFSNALAEQTPRRLVILVLDTINTPMLDQVYAREQLIGFLADNVDSGAVLSLLVIGRGGRVRIIHDFTTDPALLIAALKKVRGTPDAATGIAADQAQADALNDEVQTLQAFASNSPQAFMENAFASAVAAQRRLAILDTLDAMQLVARAYAGVPGRKALVWATAGFPFTISGSDGMLSAARGIPVDGLADILPDYEKTWQVLNDANMVVYPVDVRGLVVANLDASVSVRSANPRVLSQMLSRQRARLQDSIDTMNSFAEMTGGKAFYNTNDLKHSFQRASEDSAAYYLLGYYLEKDAKPGWHKLKVEVAHGGAHVRARSGFFVTAATQQFDRTRQSDLAQAISSPLDFTGVPLTVRWTGSSPQENSAKRKVTFDVALPPSALNVDEDDSNHVFVELIGVARTRQRQQVADFDTKIDGHLRAESLSKLRASGLTAHGTMEVPPGNYLVRFVVRDGISGRLGSLVAPLKVE